MLEILTLNCGCCNNLAHRRHRNYRRLSNLPKREVTPGGRGWGGNVTSHCGWKPIRFTADWISGFFM